MRSWEKLPNPLLSLFSASLAMISSDSLQSPVLEGGRKRKRTAKQKRKRDSRRNCPSISHLAHFLLFFSLFLFFRFFSLFSLLSFPQSSFRLQRSCTFYFFPSLSLFLLFVFALLLSTFFICLFLSSFFLFCFVGDGISVGRVPLTSFFPRFSLLLSSRLQRFYTLSFLLDFCLLFRVFIPPTETNPGPLTSLSSFFSLLAFSSFCLQQILHSVFLLTLPSSFSLLYFFFIHSLCLPVLFFWLA